MERKIAIMASSWPPLGSGGIQASHYNLFGALERQGYRVKAFTYFDDKSEDSHSLSRHGLFQIVKKIIRFLSEFYFVCRGEKGAKFQFSNAIIGAVGGSLAFRSIKKFDPDVVIVPDHGVPTAWWPSSLDAKVIVISHHNALRFSREPLLGLHSKHDALLANKMEEKVYQKCSRVICPSAYMAEEFKKSYGAPAQLDIVPNLIDTNFIDQVKPNQLLEKLQFSEAVPLVYLPSGDSTYKGCDYIFEIIRRIANYYQKPIGFYLSGKLKAKQIRQLEFLPKNVKLHAPGIQPYHTNIAMVKACTICISPTLIENFSMALLEALYCGLPCITFDVGGNREMIVNKKNGFLVPYFDLEKLIQRAITIIVDNELRLVMSEKAHNMVKSKFTEDRVSMLYKQIFFALIEGNNKHKFSDN